MQLDIPPVCVSYKLIRAGGTSSKNAAVVAGPRPTRTANQSRRVYQDEDEDEDEDYDSEATEDNTVMPVDTADADFKPTKRM